VPDYSETESVLIYKVHHSLGDGVANILMFFSITDDSKIEDVPELVPRFSCCTRFLIGLIMPLYSPLVAIHTLFMTFE